MSITPQFKLLCKNFLHISPSKRIFSQIFHELDIIKNPFMTECQIDIRNTTRFLPETLLNATMVYEKFSIY